MCSLRNTPHIPARSPYTLPHHPPDTPSVLRRRSFDLRLQSDGVLSCLQRHRLLNCCSSCPCSARGRRCASALPACKAVVRSSPPVPATASHTTCPAPAHFAKRVVTPARVTARITNSARAFDRPPPLPAGKLFVMVDNSFPDAQLDARISLMHRNDTDPNDTRRSSIAARRATATRPSTRASSRTRASRRSEPTTARATREA